MVKIGGRLKITQTTPKTPTFTTIIEFKKELAALKKSIGVSADKDPNIIAIEAFLKQTEPEKPQNNQSPQVERDKDATEAFIKRISISPASDSEDAADYLKRLVNRGSIVSYYLQKLGAANQAVKDFVVKENDATVITAVITAAREDNIILADDTVKTALTKLKE
jgi:hypothetical protein